MTSNKKKKTSIDAQLECKASADLNSQIVDELMAEDKSLSELLDESQWESEGGSITPPEKEEEESSEV